MMPYYGGESSSPFPYNDMSFFTKRYWELQELVFKPNSTSVPISSCDQETQSWQCFVQGEPKQSQPQCLLPREILYKP